MNSPSSWIREVRVSCAEVAQELGLAVRRRHLPACPTCGVSKRGSGQIYRATSGKSRWHCHRCDSDGDAIDLVARAHFGAGFSELDSADRVAVRKWLAARGWAPGSGHRFVSQSRRAAPAPAPSPARGRPDRGELRRFCGALAPVAEVATVADYLRRHGLDPVAVAYGNLAKAVPPGTATPGWAIACGRRWDPHYALVLPAYGSTGRVESLRARWVEATKPPPGVPKAAAAACGPGSATGLVLANAAGVELLRGTRLGPAKVVILEGETDFLHWATKAPALDGRLGVLAIWNGAWSDAIAARLPPGSDVCVRTDNDKDGDKYARQITESLGDRCIVRRKLPVEAPDGHAG